MTCYRNGGCGPFEMYSCNVCPASKPEYLQREQPKPKTRADQIRAMSDKKLASYLNKVETDGRVYGPQGYAYWLDWLRQEVEE